MNGTMLALSRLFLGIAQGLALYILYDRLQAKAWPATAPEIFAPLAIVAVYVPAILAAGLGTLRGRTLLLWAPVAAAVLSGLALHDVGRGFYDASGDQVARAAGSPALWFFAAVGLFIAHAMVTAGDQDRRIIASYPRYFDVAWKQGVQLALSVLFVGSFWVLLWLGANLFRLIQLSFVFELIRKPWFAAPATAAMFALAIHVTDVRAALVRGLRSLALTLLSWLLPLMAALALAFLLALPFTGLEPLWHTGRATHMLLSAAAALIVLLNAAYQDGAADSLPARVMRYVQVAAALALIPLVAVSAYGLSVRVGQYGWTQERIVALSYMVIAGCYAAGYALAVVTGATTLRLVAATNIVTAFVVLAVLLVLFSPLGDPTRLAVADQVARLQSGRVAPEKFDYAFLRWSAGRFGIDALERLKADRGSPRAIEIATRADAALRLQTRYAVTPPPEPATPQERGQIISVRTAGKSLPESFIRQEWNISDRTLQLPHCLTAKGECDALIVDLDDDGVDEILLFSSPTGTSTAFKLVDGTWTVLGTLANTSCAGVRDALKAGQAETVPARYRQIEVAGSRMWVVSPCR